MILVAPNAASSFRALPYFQALSLVSPYVTLAIGLIWTFIAWGLFQMRDWARFIATLMLGIGVGWTLPLLLLGKHPAWRMLVNFPQIILRIWGIYYLLTPSIIDAFRAKQPEHASSSAPLR